MDFDALRRELAEYLWRRVDLVLLLGSLEKKIRFSSNHIKIQSSIWFVGPSLNFNFSLFKQLLREKEPPPPAKRLEPWSVHLIILAARVNLSSSEDFASCISVYLPER